MLSKCLARQIFHVTSQLKPTNVKPRSFSLKANLNADKAAEGVAQNAPKTYKKLSKSRILLYLFVGIGGCSFAYYHLALESKKKRKVRIVLGGFSRAVRSFRTGAAIGIDYKWNLWGLDENSKEYDEAIKQCHNRAGERMVETCIKNGGIYVKLGQAISTMNEILPKELCMKLRKLQTEAIRSKGNDVCYFEVY